MKWKETLKKVALEVLKVLKWVGVALLVGFITYKIGAHFFAKTGRVDKPKKFVPVPGDDSKILIRDDEKKEWVEVKLPDKVKSKDIQTAGFNEGNKEAVVEIKHKVVNRRKTR